MRTDPREFYCDQLDVALAQHRKLLRRISLLSWARSFVVLATILGAWLMIRYAVGLCWCIAVPGAAAFLVLLNYHNYIRKKEWECRVWIQVLNEDLKALDGDFRHHPEGKQYIDPSHSFSYDLDIFGKGSIFQLLCRVVTMHGAEALAQLLKNPYAANDAHCISRQRAIQELSSLPEFLLHYRVAGRSAPESVGDFDKIVSWLDGRDLFEKKKIVHWLVWICPTITLAAIALSLVQGAWHPALGLSISLNWIVLLLFRKQTRAGFFYSGKLAGFVGKYEGVFRATAQMQFEHPVLQQAAVEATAAVKGIPGLRKLVQRIENRQNPFVGPLMNALFLYDIQNIVALERWRKREGLALRTALQSSGSFDARISLGVYAFHHPDYIFPELTAADQPFILGCDVKHPLLPQTTAIGNDFDLGRSEQMYLLTGANMTGKSTFIRTVGISMIMTHMGLPLPAKSLSISLCRIFTSMRITDSVQEDISYFKAELNRIRDLLVTVRDTEHAHLVLLDEPLRGTNSGDKQSGTEAIIRNLLRNRVIGIVATHDTSLGRLEQDLPGKLRNYHFESQLTGGRLEFDFKLKPGCSQTNNATLLMKEMGIL